MRSSPASELVSSAGNAGVAAIATSNLPSQQQPQPTTPEPQPEAETGAGADGSNALGDELEAEAANAAAARARASSEAARRLADLRALAAADRESQYQRAVADLQSMLGKAERFNAGCDALASESPFLCKEQPRDFSGGTLRDYQMEAVQWLSEKHWLGESCILADEMGLGKTVMVAGLIAWMRAAPVQDGPVLVVAPLSTLRNWVNELRKFCPGMPVVEYHGDKNERAALRREHIPHLPRWAGKVPTRPGQRPGGGAVTGGRRTKGKSEGKKKNDGGGGGGEGDEDEDEDEILDAAELKEQQQAALDREAMKGWRAG